LEVKGMKSLKLIMVPVLLVVAASAAMAEPQCQPINVRVGQATSLGTCVFDGTEYGVCVDTPLKGTLNGIWHFYGDGGFVTAFPDPPFSSLFAGWGLDAIETNRGAIYAQDNYIWNLSVFGLEGTKAAIPAVSLSVITGGTGHYEGATGWFAAIYDDGGGGWRGFIRGEICTPDE
jgi:hypothetical protein